MREVIGYAFVIKRKCFKNIPLGKLKNLLCIILEELLQDAASKDQPCSIEQPAPLDLQSEVLDAGCLLCV